MKFIVALLFAVSAQAFACDLDFPTAGVCGTARWIQGPVFRTESTLDLSFSPFVEPNTVKVDAWMPEHNHGTRPVTLTTNADGSITVTKLYFVMRGEWVVRVSIPVVTGAGNTLMETAELPVQL